MFPACWFRQRTCVAQGFVNGVLNEIELTLVSSIKQPKVLFKQFVENNCFGI